MQELLSEFSIYKAISIFFIYIVIDILYASYILAVSEKKAQKAAFISSLTYGLLAVGVISYSENILYLVPLLCGSYIGTYLLVKKESDKQNGNTKN